MDVFDQHMKKVYSRFNNTINNYQVVKETILQNPSLSQYKIALIIQKSQSYISKTIRIYNFRENRQKNTNKINYFYLYNKITDADYIQIILKMIKDTENNPFIFFKTNEELSKMYKTHTYIVSAYSAYMLSGLNRTQYSDMINHIT